jgi:hypothetical protein
LFSHVFKLLECGECAFVRGVREDGVE